jgi:hypothetical protein
MPALTGTAVSATPSVDEQFLTLMCSDADLLRAEFEALVAEDWPGTPAKRPGVGAAAGHPDTRASRWRLARQTAPVVASSHRPVGLADRQRSPPAIPGASALIIRDTERQVIGHTRINPDEVTAHLGFARSHQHAPDPPHTWAATAH